MVRFHAWPISATLKPKCDTKIAWSHGHLQLGRYCVHQDLQAVHRKIHIWWWSTIDYSDLLKVPNLRVMYLDSIRMEVRIWDKEVSIQLDDSTDLTIPFQVIDLYMCMYEMYSFTSRERDTRPNICTKGTYQLSIWIDFKVAGLPFTSNCIAFRSRILWLMIGEET